MKKSLEEKIESAREKYEQEVAEIRLLHEAELRATQKLGREPERVHPHTAYADAVVCYSTDDIVSALLFAERCDPEGIYRVKDGHLAFKPWDAMTERERDIGEVIGPWTLTCDTTRGYRTRWVLHLYRTIQDIRLEVRIEIPDAAMLADGYRVTYEYKPPSKYAPEGTVERCELSHPSDHFKTVSRYWAPPGQVSSFVLY